VRGGLKAIVCDDAPGFQVLMVAMLEEAGLEITGQGATWTEAEELAAARPDVIVLDLWMPRFDVDALQRIRATCASATIAVITALPMAEAAERVAGARVDLLLSKSEPPAEVAEAIAERARARIAAT
jgi:DNA-binding NarL/FixJ family response regulator